MPVFGIIVDRYGPALPSLFSACAFGFGYFLAAFAYRSGPPPDARGQGWPFWSMIVAFVGIGVGTSAMYISAVTTCAKNFGRGKYKGIALAIPIAAFGLSGMWQSQVGSNLLYEKNPDGSKGDVDVFRYFVFLGSLLLATGILGALTLRIVDEEELVNEQIEEMERSGLLEDSPFFSQSAHPEDYGTMSAGSSVADMADMEASGTLSMKRRRSEDARRKTFLLNASTSYFLSDRTMWLLAAGFFFVTGPGEAFINNLGTIIGTLSDAPPPQHPSPTSQTTAATHVSILAITSTLARIVIGTLSDLLAPTAPSKSEQKSSPPSPSLSATSLPEHDPMAYRDTQERGPFIQISRMTFLITLVLALSLGFLLLANGALQSRASLFWIVSALVGVGYGAAFSLTPIIVSVVWGVEGFGTNWGIITTAPAFGAALWGAIYAVVYQSATSPQVPGTNGDEDSGDVLCYGTACYAPTFWAMTLSVWFACALWVWAWRGPGGWKARGIAV